MYVCGITPYDATHLGHAFTYLTFDLVIRRLEDLGHEVHMVRNVTDVDDSILGKARELGVDYLNLATSEVASFHEDLAALDLRPASAEPRATESIQSILDLIDRLESTGHTYTVEGTTFFDTSTWEGFGSVSGYDEATMVAYAAERGANPDDPRLRNPLDFILWQASADDEPSWDSPFGPGRPGWHIECSAMAMAELGQTIDLHGGGDDLVFPHHECEETQSGAANGVPLTRHWMHVAMVSYEGIKMSKSLGNLVFIRNLRHLHDPRAIRLSLLAHHYRAGFEWFDHDIDDGVTRLDRLITAAGRPTGPDPAPTLATIRNALDDDLNTAAARDALDMLAGAILAGAGKNPGSAAGLTEAAGLLGIRLDESVPESWVRTT
jgi:L-cysteine:1D-myo-inositol 2-amino-2-deoxy-alpha-D-glucopyranoside ligase